MGKTNVTRGSRVRHFASASDPLLRNAVGEPAFGAPTRIGVEIEFMVFELGQTVSLGQASGGLTPGELLTRLYEVAGPGAVLATDSLNDYPVGLTLPNGGRFSLENGGQLEYASTPVETLDSVAAELADALALCERAADGKLAFLSHGTHPTLEARLDPLVPNSRFSIMERFFAPDSIHSWGNHACAIQVNLDMVDEASWGDGWRLGYALSRFAFHMFGNSAYLHGARATDGPARLSLTRRMDARRREVPAAVVLSDDPAQAYTDWALDASVIFAGDLPIDEQPLQGELRFRDWLDAGYKDQFPDYTSWLMHLGTLWPDVRPRRFIEMRAADAQPFGHTMAVVAVWQALIQRPAGQRALASYLSDAFTQDAGAAPHATLAALLSRPYDHPVFCDPAHHAALLDIAARVLADAGEGRWAESVNDYGRFHAAKADYWQADGPDAFIRKATSMSPAAELAGAKPANGSVAERV